MPVVRPRSYYSTPRWSGSYYAPLPVRPVSSGVVPESNAVVECLTRGVRSCSREFTGPGFRLCMYGMMTASNLLPAGVARSSHEDVIDASGAFAAGMRHSCPTSDPSYW